MNVTFAALDRAGLGCYDAACYMADNRGDFPPDQMAAMVGDMVMAAREAFSAAALHASTEEEAESMRVSARNLTPSRAEIIAACAAENYGGNEPAAFSLGLWFMGWIYKARGRTR